MEIMNPSPERKDADTIMEHLFRKEYVKIIANLTNRYGTHYLEAIEDAVQESMVKAMKSWSFNALPNNPSG